MPLWLGEICKNCGKNACYPIEKVFEKISICPNCKDDGNVVVLKKNMWWWFWLKKYKWNFKNYKRNICILHSACSGQVVWNLFSLYFNELHF